jgi:inorganic pyrophosphatase
MDLWHDLPAGEKEKLNVIIEIPKLSRAKYEWDKTTGLIKVDRILYAPIDVNYGFASQTLWDDGDPLDILVLSHEPFVTGCLIKARPIGVLNMIDEGKSDVKILTVPAKDSRFDKINDIADVDQSLLEKVRTFFKEDGEFQKEEMEIKGWEGKEKALTDIERSFVLYKEKYNK